jgi:hypothetical protein
LALDFVQSITYEHSSRQAVFLARGPSVTFAKEPMMFNVSPTSAVPGFRVIDPLQDVPGFRVQTSDPAGYGFVDAGGARSLDGGVTPRLVPGPGGDGSGHGWDKCTLVSGSEQFGFCLYACPDGTVRRTEKWALGGLSAMDSPE